MDAAGIDSANRVALPTALALFFLLALVWPTLRTWRRTGIWPITIHRTTDSLERVNGRAMALIFAGLFAWGAVYALRGAGPLCLWPAPPLLLLGGWALMLVGFVLLLLAQAQMGASWRVGVDERPTALVTSGLFRLVRNPIYSALLAMMTGLVLVTPSPWTAMGWVYAATVVSQQTRLEEQHLVRLHGAAYLAYAARVGRFVPGIGRLRDR